MEAVLDSPLRCREAEDPGIQLGGEKRYFKANGCALQKVSLIKAKWKREALRRETEKHPNTWQGNLSMPFPGKSCFLQHLLFPRGSNAGVPGSIFRRGDHPSQRTAWAQARRVLFLWIYDVRTAAVQSSCMLPTIHLLFYGMFNAAVGYKEDQVHCNASKT